jgi:HAD superfamily hydrolase (TIGR01509 family)
MAKIKALLFDFDGVVLDTYSSYRQLVVDVLNELNYNITLKDAIKRWKGLNSEQIARQLVFEGFEYADEFVIRVNEKSKLYKTNESMIVDGLLDVLNASNLPKAICSNGRSIRVKSNLEDVKLLNYFNEVVGRDIAQTMKPKPDVYLVGAEKLGFDIKQCLAIEDSVVGLQAAVASGAITVAFTGTGGIKEELAKENPDYIVNDLREVIKIVNDLNK